MKSKFVVWDCHVMVWLAVETVLDEMFLMWSISPNVVLLLLASNSLLVIGQGILLLSSESGLVFMWGQLMVSVWLVKELFIMMNWAVLWHVWVVMVIVMVFAMTNVVRWCIGIVMWGLNVVVFTVVAPVASPVVNFSVVCLMMRGFVSGVKVMWGLKMGIAVVSFEAVAESEITMGGIVCSKGTSMMRSSSSMVISIHVVACAVFFSDGNRGYNSASKECSHLLRLGFKVLLL